ncbi:hypothetical protein [Micromonospora tarensis]|uniref:Uncharacterized protein n=1 Tax=Micromonospora tarensis TaxID=2806100 RepID=A0ABS1Y9T8_9ACTN|nr:hypothetical protein [Micromonospora tarensis]MBM0274162.1 hypothetical protein [Micromonospora tarensis]
MYHHLCTKRIIGWISAVAALLLILALAVHAIGCRHPVTSDLFVLGGVAATLLGMVSIRLLLGDSAAYVQGVRETVDRLAAALPKTGDRPQG